MSDDDARLREHFDALRREDVSRAPDFVPAAPAERTVRGQGAAWPRLPWLLAATTASVALLWLARGTQAPAPALEDFAVGSWSMPSDVLLETPGRELLGSPGWEPAAPVPDAIGPQSRIRGRSHG